ncbi:TPA: phage tail protein [Serratia marcescens]|nr:phage tail protein [Serratia marcescens]HBK4675035.1 phage tail protein [Serratia marcescens]
MQKFFNLITDVGAKKIALAAESGVPVKFSMMAVGDGGGTTPMPTPGQQSLVNELFRSELNSLKIWADDANVIVADLIVPAHVGGFWIREVGLYSEDGALVAVGNLPPTYKPLLSEGSGRIETVKMHLIVSSTASVELKVDPSAVMATIEYVDDAVRAAMSTADNAMELAKQKVTFDEMYPIGDTKFFAKILNPNEQWPGTLWYPLEESRTIRLAKADGSDVGEKGGSDTVTIARENLPAESLGLKGFTDSMDFGVMRTETSGKHVHGGVPKRNSTYELGGNNRVFFDPYDQGETDEAGEHDHTFTIPTHNHTLEGETDELGQGKAFGIVNKFITLYGWYRAA